MIAKLWGIVFQRKYQIYPIVIAYVGIIRFQTAVHIRVGAK